MFSKNLKGKIALIMSLCIGLTLGNVSSIKADEKQLKTEVTNNKESEISLGDIIANLDFIPTDMIINTEKTAVFMISAEQKKLLKLNLADNTIEEKILEYIPRKLAYQNNRIYIAMDTDDGSNKGRIDKLEADTLGLTKTYFVGNRIVDLQMVGDNIFACYEGGSVWGVYLGKTGDLISTGDPRYNKDTRATSIINNNTKSIYFYNNNGFIYGHDVKDDGQIQPKKYTWKKIKENLDEKFFVAKDGNLIFNQSGEIYTSTTSNNNDVNYIMNLGYKFESMDFNEQGTEFYIGGSEGNITGFNYNTLTKISVGKVEGSINKLFDANNSLIVGYRDIDDKFIIKNITKEQLQKENASELFTGEVVDKIYNSKNSKAYFIVKNRKLLYEFDTLNKSLSKVFNLDYMPVALSLSDDKEKMYVLGDSLEYVELNKVNLYNNEIISKEYYYPIVKTYGDRKITVKDGMIYVDTMGYGYDPVYQRDTAKSGIKIHEETLNRIEPGPGYSYTLAKRTFSADGQYMFVVYYERATNLTPSGYLELYFKPYSISKFIRNGQDFYIFNSSVQLTEYMNLEYDVNLSPLISLDGSFIIYDGLTMNIENLEQCNVTFKDDSLNYSNETGTIFGSNNNLYLSKNLIKRPIDLKQGEKLLFVTEKGEVFITDSKNNIRSYKINSYDINNDEKIDELDLEEVIKRYNATASSENYSINCDINADGIIDIYDTVLMKNEIKVAS